VTSEALKTRPVELVPPDAESVSARIGRRPVVYICQETRLNVLPASRFGELEFLLPEHVQLVLTPQPVVRVLRERLAAYTRDDYILPTGDPAVIGVVTALAAMLTGGVVRILKWDGQERRYYQVLLDLREGA
jgi:hypothetical protein